MFYFSNLSNFIVSMPARDRGPGSGMLCILGMGMMEVGASVEANFAFSWPGSISRSHLLLPMPVESHFFSSRVEEILDGPSTHCAALLQDPFAGRGSENGRRRTTSIASKALCAGYRHGCDP